MYKIQTAVLQILWISSNSRMPIELNIYRLYQENSPFSRIVDTITLHKLVKFLLFMFFPSTVSHFMLLFTFEYYLKGDSQIEYTNQTLKQYLYVYSKYNIIFSYIHNFAMDINNLQNTLKAKISAIQQ